MAAVNHFYGEELTAQSHDADTNFATLKSIAGASLLANTNYLIVAQMLFNGKSTSRKFDGRVTTADDSTIASKSTATVEPSRQQTDQAAVYFFVHSFQTDASPADVLLQFRTGNTASAAQADQISLFLLDLDDLESANFHETISADDGVEYPTASAVQFSIAGSNLGTDEWLILAYQMTGIGSVSENFRVEAHAANDTSTTALRALNENEGEDTDEKRTTGIVLRHKASSGTPNFEVHTSEESITANMLNKGGYAIALKTSAFADFASVYTAGSTAIEVTEATFQTVSSYSPSVTADHLLFGVWNQTGTTITAATFMHIEDDGVELRVGDVDMSASERYDVTALPHHVLFHLDNIDSTDTSTYTLRGTADATGNSVEHRWLIILSLEKATVAPVGVFPPFPRRQLTTVRM